MRNVKQIRQKLLYIFYYRDTEQPYKEIIFHIQELIYPRRCTAYKQLQSMLSSGKVRCIGYRTQYENEIL